MPFVFFFSYAHRNKTQDKKLENFFQDLATEVGQDMGETKPGFFDDEGLRVGDEWSPKLVDALQTSKVLVCLVSADYLSSTVCGKELQVFLERRKQHGGEPAVILPIIWTLTPTRQLSPILKKLQYTDGRLPSSYSEIGLRSLMMSDDQTAYRQLLLALKESIIKAAQLDPPLPPLSRQISLDSIDSAHAGERQVAGGEPGVPSVSAARVFYVAARDHEIAAAELRNDTAHYGSSGFVWKPYHPSNTTTVGLMTSESVGGIYEIKSIDLGPQIVERLVEAEAQGDAILLIVDPWTLWIKKYQLLMEKFDDRSPLRSGVVIPWNPHDPESREFEGKLKAVIRLTFKKFFHITNRFRWQVCTKEDFSSAINHIMTHITLNAEDLQLAAKNISLAGPPMPVLSAAAGGGVR